MPAQWNEVEVHSLSVAASQFVEEGKLLHAAQMYLKLVREVPLLVDPYLRLALIYVAWGHRVDARRILNRGIAYSGDGDACAVALGDLCMEFGKYREALNCYGVRCKRPTASVLYRIGLAYHRLNKVHKAEEAIRAALRMDPKLFQAREVLGEILLQRHEHAAAVGELRRALRENPYSAFGQRLLGNALMELRRAPEAHEAFCQAIDMDPKDASAWQLCGEALLRMRRYNEAELYLQRALALNPRLPDASAGLGEICLHRGNMRQAREAFNAALRVRPGHPRALDGKLRTRMHSKGLWTRLATLMMTLLSASVLAFAQEGTDLSYEAEVLFQGAVAQYDSTHFAKAASEFDLLLRLYPNCHRSTAAHIMKAKALYWVDNNLEAAKTAKAFLEEHSASRYRSDAHLLLGLIYRRIERPREALAELVDAWEVLPTPEPPRLLIGIAANLDSIVRENLALVDLEGALHMSHRPDCQAVLRTSIVERELTGGKLKTARLMLDTLVALYPGQDLPERIRLLRARIVGGGRVTIATLLPMMQHEAPSATRTIGQEIFEGVVYAVEKYAHEPDAAIKVELRDEDTERSAERAVQGVATLAADSAVVGIIGPVFSSIALPAAQAANAAGIPLLSPTANANGIAAIGPSIFQLNPDYDMRGRAMAKYAINRLGLHHLAVLAPAISYGRFLANGFINEAYRLGAKVVAVEWYEKGTTDLKPQLLAIREKALRENEEPYLSFAGKRKRTDIMKLAGLGVPLARLDSLMSRGAVVKASQLLGPDAKTRLDSAGIAATYHTPFLDSLEIPVETIQALYVPINSVEEIGVVSPQIVYFNFRTQLLGSGEWNDMAELNEHSRYCTGVMFESENAYSPTSQMYLRFADGFASRFKKQPSPYSLYGYDTADLLLSAVRSGTFTRDAVSRFLAGVRSFQGVHAKIGFTSGRVNSWLGVMQFDGSNVRPIDEIQVE